MRTHDRNHNQVIEELYLALQILVLLYLLNKSFPLMAERTESFMPYFTGVYFICVAYRVWKHFTHCQNESKIFSSVIDGFFVWAYLWIFNPNENNADNLIFAYVTIQALRYTGFYVIWATSMALVMEVYLMIDKQREVGIFLGNGVYIVFTVLCIGMVIKHLFLLQNEKEFYCSELVVKNQELDRLASTDYLTGLYNHKSFYLRLKQFKELAYNTHKPVSMALIDIDNFKKINDTYGHLAGDEILKQLAQCLQESIRKTDFVARYGGEEFVVLFPETPLDTAAILSERLRTKVSEQIFVFENFKIPVTVSIGIGCLEDCKTSEIQSFVKSVDLLLYQAKRTGKNKVVCENKRRTCLEP